MTNFRQERLLKEKRQKIYGALLLIILIIILGRGPIFSFFGRVGHFIGLPLWKTGQSFTDAEDYATEYIKPKSELVGEVLSLRKLVEENKSDEAIISVLETENKNLKALQGRDAEKGRVLARVLSRPPIQIYDTLIIDIGSNKGIEEGALVYTKNDFVIGKVTRVNDNSSVVTLSSSPKETYSVILRVEGADDVSSSTKDFLQQDITFTGIGGGGFIAQVPKHIKVREGTPMTVPTITPSIIGIITGESIPENGSLKEIYGSLPFGIRSVEWVSVEVKK